MKNSEEFVEIPTLMKVTEDICKLSVPFPYGMRHVNSYFFKGKKGFTVIDTGFHSKKAIKIWEQVLSLGISIEKVIITHVHKDHIGLAGWLQKEHHIPVYISNLGYQEMKRIRDDYSGKWMSSFFIRHGSPEIYEIHEGPFSYQPSVYEFEPDEVFECKQKIMLGNDMYETIWTPGHSLDHFCFYNPERQLMVVGDLVLDGFSPIVAVWSDQETNPLKQYFESLDSVCSYSTKIALPGHGKLIQNLSSKAEDIKLGHMYRMKQILGILGDKGKTAGQVNEEMYAHVSRDQFMALLMATITRLIYLESVGKANCEVKNGKYYYSSVN